MSVDDRRNKPCHCGSGRKYKNCCLAKDLVPRHRGVTFSVNEDVWVTGFEINRETGEIRLMSGSQVVQTKDAKSAEWRVDSRGRYRRKYELDAISNKLIIDPEAALSFADYIFGVDTNQFKAREKFYNVCCVTQRHIFETPTDFLGSIEPLWGLDFCDSDFTPERLGWLFAIKAIQAAGVPHDQRVVLCTDHDVMCHTAINHRESPLLENFYLPKNFLIIYASDKGSSLPNKLVATAHKNATRLATRLDETSGFSGQIISRYLLDDQIKEVYVMSSDNLNSK